MGDGELKMRTKKFSIAVAALINKLKKDFITYEISKQLLRSGMSVGANTSAAFRGRSRKEFVAKLGIVIEEADECTFWLDVLKEFNQNEISTINDLRNEANELVSIFVSICSKYNPR